MGSNAIAGRAFNFQLPSGIVFDPVNQLFLVANSLQNNVSIVNPTTFNQTLVQVGINPTSLDYNFQTSTLVTVNSASNTMSVVDYLCPSGWFWERLSGSKGPAGSGARRRAGRSSHGHRPQRRRD